MAAALAPVVDDQPDRWPSDQQYVEELVAEGFSLHEVSVWLRTRQHMTPAGLRRWAWEHRN